MYRQYPPPSTPQTPRRSGASRWRRRRWALAWSACEKRYGVKQKSPCKTRRYSFHVFIIYFILFPFLFSCLLPIRHARKNLADPMNVQIRGLVSIVFYLCFCIPPVPFFAGNDSMAAGGMEGRAHRASEKYMSPPREAEVAFGSFRR